MMHLLQHGAGVDALDASGITPLMCAANGDHRDAAGLLCDYGADVSERAKELPYQEINRAIPLSAVTFEVSFV